MAEPYPPPEEVNDYLLGQLTPARRREFAERLAHDAGLRQHIRELEEGLLALAMTAPRREPPRKIWTQIETAVSKSARQNFWFPFLELKWLAKGWAVTGCLVAAVLIHSYWTRERPSISVASGGSEVKTNFVTAPPPNLATLPTFVTNRQTGLVENNPPGSDPWRATTNPATAPPSANVAAIASARAAPPSSLKTTVAHRQSRVSPAMQRAAFRAFAWQMGWTNEPSAPDSEVPVDFVDLPDPTAADTVPPLVAADLPGNSGLWDPVAPADPGLPPPSIPMLALNNNIFVPIDPGSLPAGLRQGVVWSVDGEGNPAIIGPFTLGPRPTILHINNADTSGGTTYIVTIGGTNFIGHAP